MLDFDWPIQTKNGLTVILLPEETASNTIIGTYGKTGIEYGGSWDRDGRFLVRDDANLDLENTRLSDEKPRWVILCSSQIEDYCADAETKKNSERIVYDGRFYTSKQAAERMIKAAMTQNAQCQQTPRYALNIACVTLHKPI